MASIDYHVQDDERELLNGPPVDRKVWTNHDFKCNKRETNNISDFYQQKTSPQPNSAPTLPDVLSPNKMMSLSLNADPENNQVDLSLQILHD